MVKHKKRNTLKRAFKETKKDTVKVERFLAKEIGFVTKRKKRR